MKPPSPNHYTGQDIAQIYRTTVGYVRKLAARDGWRRVRVGRIMHYHLDDADQSLNKGQP